LCFTKDKFTLKLSIWENNLDAIKNIIEDKIYGAKQILKMYNVVVFSHAFLQTSDY